VRVVLLIFQWGWKIPQWSSFQDTGISEKEKLGGGCPFINEIYENDPKSKSSAILFSVTHFLCSVKDLLLLFASAMAFDTTIFCFTFHKGLQARCMGADNKLLKVLVQGGNVYFMWDGTSCHFLFLLLTYPMVVPFSSSTWQIWSSLFWYSDLVPRWGLGCWQTSGPLWLSYIWKWVPMMSASAGLKAHLTQSLFGNFNVQLTSAYV